MASKVKFDFSALAELAEKLDDLEGDVKAATTDALEKSQKHIAVKLHKDMSKHKQTGTTEAAIIDDAQVKWEGTAASIEVGFDIANGGLPSIFLMYGTPRMKKDQKLYDDVFGNGTKKEIAKIQQEVFGEAIKERMGG